MSHECMHKLITLLAVIQQMCEDLAHALRAARRAPADGEAQQLARVKRETTDAAGLNAVGTHSDPDVRTPKKAKRCEPQTAATGFSPVSHASVSPCGSLAGNLVCAFGSLTPGVDT
jgi:hypothetical protein